MPGISRVWRIDLLLVPCTLMMDPRGNMAAPQHTLHSNNSVIRYSGTTRQGSLLTSCQSSPFLSTSFRLDKPSQTQFLSCQRLPLYLTAPLFACFSIQKARCRSVFQLHQCSSRCFSVLRIFRMGGPELFSNINQLAVRQGFWTRSPLSCRV